MCGIVGYIGKRPAAPIILDGLQALEYRGYDSAGIALIDKDKKSLIKQIGRVESLRRDTEAKKPESPLAIGHTRWATHGVPSVTNAHPHTNTDRTIFVVHNGIIENYMEIRTRLQKDGYVFVSETDTEVVPHLIDYYAKELKSFEKAFKAALKDLHGAYAIAAVSTKDPETLYAARLSSPLVIGVGKKEHFLASDPAALLEHTKKVMYLDDSVNI
jgi:glucosamine--fructose-6-phosphate aminotransferase (isomerizing)